MHVFYRSKVSRGKHSLAEIAEIAEIYLRFLRSLREINAKRNISVLSV